MFDPHCNTNTFLEFLISKMTNKKIGMHWIRILLASGE